MTNLDAAIELLVETLYAGYPSKPDIRRVLHSAMDHQSMVDEFRIDNVLLELTRTPSYFIDALPNEPMVARSVISGLLHQAIAAIRARQVSHA